MSEGVVEKLSKYSFSGVLPVVRAEVVEPQKDAFGDTERSVNEVFLWSLLPGSDEKFFCFFCVWDVIFVFDKAFFFEVFHCCGVGKIVCFVWESFNFFWLGLDEVQKVLAVFLRCFCSEFFDAFELG